MAKLKKEIEKKIVKHKVKKTIKKAEKKVAAHLTPEGRKALKKEIKVIRQTLDNIDKEKVKRVLKNALEQAIIELLDDDTEVEAEVEIKTKKKKK